MASEALLDFDSLIAPIAGDNPAGESLVAIDDIKRKLEEDRKEGEIPPMEPGAEVEMKRADWRSVERVAKEGLVKRSKEIFLVARLTEALVKQYGFAGLRDGLQLLRMLVEHAWDRILPPIDEDGDMELRASRFYLLDDETSGIRFPMTVRQVPLVQGEDGPYSYLDFRPPADSKAKTTAEQFKKAIDLTPPELLQTKVDDLTLACEELDKVVAALTEKMGHAVAPALTGLRQPMGECLTLLKQALQQKVGDAAAIGDGEAAAGQVGGIAGGGSASSRAEVYRQLRQAAAALRQMEPHSPIPYLVDRAVELGGLPFPLLIKALIRDANTLSELYREFGIKDEQQAVTEGG